MQNEYQWGIGLDVGRQVKFVCSFYAINNAVVCFTHDPAGAEEAMRRHVYNAKAHIAKCQDAFVDSRDGAGKE